MPREISKIDKEFQEAYNKIKQAKMFGKDSVGVIYIYPDDEQALDLILEYASMYNDLTK